MRERRVQIGVAGAIALTGAGFCIQFLESFSLDRLHIEVFGTENYLLGTVAFATGIFLLAATLRSEARSLSFLANLGQLSLGVYCIHLIFILWIETRIQPGNLTQSMELAVVVAATSTLVVFMLANFPGTRRLVS